jgi:hypothetical protein
MVLREGALPLIFVPGLVLFVFTRLLYSLFSFLACDKECSMSRNSLMSQSKS